LPVPRIPQRIVSATVTPLRGAANQISVSAA
jgi:hypothetical protein